VWPWTTRAEANKPVYLSTSFLCTRARILARFASSPTNSVLRRDLASVFVHPLIIKRREQMHIRVMHSEFREEEREKETRTSLPLSLPKFLKECISSSNLAGE